MNAQPNSRLCPQQSGFTMVELLIALGLGLLLLLAVSAVFLGSRQSFRTQEGMSQLQETGRMVSYLMYPYIRLAGYLPDPLNDTDPTVYFDSNARAIFGTNNSVPTIPGITSTTVLSGTDSITARYISPATGPLLSGCNGVSYTGGITEVTFYIGSQDPNGVWSLMCKVRNISRDSAHTELASPGPQPLLSGVRDLQITYGVDTDNDMVSNQFLDASGVTDWTAVRDVRIDLTIESSDTVAAAGTSGAGLSAAGRATRQFSTTLQLRNRLRF